MYERVWEGTAPGLDGAEWDLFLDFNQDRGCSGLAARWTESIARCGNAPIR